MAVDLPWTEKYRPRRLDEIVGQKEVVERLKAYVKSKNLPNLLFAGRAGVGKTTAALCLANELFGEENVEHNFLELNASDERGIDVVRGKIKDFARTLPLGDVPFKIIFLDEADALTADAQHALRRTMEKYSGATRFILSCNYSSKIIEPIQSRTTVLRFKPLSEDEIIGRLKYIAQCEGLEVDEDAYRAITYIAEGDMRKAINVLQGAAALERHITRDLVFKVSSRATPEEIKEVIELAMKGKFHEAREKLHEVMINYGMSGEDVLLQIYREVQGLELDERVKVKLIDRIGEYNFRLVEGANEVIQLEALLAQIAMICGGE